MGLATRPNVLLITLDQFRADCWGAAGHPAVRTPHLDALAAGGVRFARHYSQAAPCAPGRASIYTGMYQFNHRVVGNGTPLDARFDNVALMARRAGYRPALFGYTDQAIDPRDADGRDDPRLSRYTGVLPGFDLELDLPDEHEAWLEWLSDLGYDITPGPERLLATEHERPEEHSVSAFLTDRAIEWISTQPEPWFAHLSYLRPHPPFSAAGEWADAYGAEAIGTPIPRWEGEPLWALIDAWAPRTLALADPGALARMRTHYLGMISHVDHQLGRLWDAVRRLDQWDATVIVVTSDHGEMLGDHGLRGKLGYWEQSYAIPCVVRDPARPGSHGSVVTRFTENVDVMPTLCDLLGQTVPAQCDGLPLTPFLDAVEPRRWRSAAHWEFDWRSLAVGRIGSEWPWDRDLEQMHLAVLRTECHAYVQFGDGAWRCFDLVADPTWRTPVVDPAVVLPLAQEMLMWRSQHTDRVLADMVCESGGIGRWPPLPGGWGSAPPAPSGVAH